MANLLLLMVVMCFGKLGSIGIVAAHEPSFVIANDSFYKDGKPFRILGGEMHYFRIVPEYWKDRILRAKAMGLNTLQTYIPWNVHEPSQGSFNFHGGVDLEAFLRLGQSLDILVMLRIGPYVCGEWDFGGFPSWLLSKQPPLKLRTSDPAYLELIDDWWNVLLPKIVPFLYSQGGPVIMLQIENEYGSYGSDKYYLHHLAVQARQLLGEDAILYTTDGATDEALEAGTIVQDNVYAAVDYPTGWDPVSAFSLQKKYNPKGSSPPLSAEFYTGWLTHWGEDLAKTSSSTTAAELDRLLAANGSVVLYMAHGGSNFGFFSGANAGGEEAIYQPDITSYDYDAPIGEGGDLGEKYFALRQVLARYSGSALPDPPVLPQRIAMGPVFMQKTMPLFEFVEAFSHGVKMQVPVAMEMLNQTSGFIVYKTLSPISSSAGKILTINQVHDRAQIFAGRTARELKRIGTIERWSMNSSIELPSLAGVHIFILVENMGRINYGPFIYDPKGILSSVLLDGIPVTGWIAYPLSLLSSWSKLYDRRIVKSLKLRKSDLQDSPAFYTGAFATTSPSDTFISFKGWNKGVAFLNGFNLGRFWPAAGPQCTLYVPASLLRSGQNKLMILELEDAEEISKSLSMKYEHDWSCGSKSQAAKSKFSKPLKLFQ